MRTDKLNGHKTVIYNDNLRKLPNECGDVSVMGHNAVQHIRFMLQSLSSISVLVKFHIRNV